MWQIPKDAGIDPAPERTTTTWSTFLRSQADALLACDFFETHTLNGTRPHVLTVIEHASRRIRVLGTPTHPTASWVTPAARNLALDLEDEDRHVRFLIRHRDGKYPAHFDAVLADAGIQIVLSGGNHGRTRSRNAATAAATTNSSTTPPIWNHQHLLLALHEYEQFYNNHRPHQGIANTRPLRALPPAVTNQAAAIRPDIHRRQRLDGILNEDQRAA